MAAKSIKEMSFTGKTKAVRNPEATSEERNEAYNVWSKEGYEKVLLNEFSFC